MPVGSTNVAVIQLHKIRLDVTDSPGRRNGQQLRYRYRLIGPGIAVAAAGISEIAVIEPTSGDAVEWRKSTRYADRVAYRRYVGTPGWQMAEQIDRPGAIAGKDRIIGIREPITRTGLRGDVCDDRLIVQRYQCAAGITFYRSDRTSQRRGSQTHTSQAQALYVIRRNRPVARLPAVEDPDIPSIFCSHMAHPFLWTLAKNL